MAKPTIRIDFVSDVACPWCAVGLASLERALERIGGGIDVDLHFQPFELNPNMPAEGEDATAHLVAKYGLTREQLEKNRATIRARGADVGFVFGERGRIVNTFDAHRLLHWAGTLGAREQRALKHALLQAYHGDARDVSDHAVLVAIAESVGLDGARTRAILASDEFAGVVRSQERYFTDRGIHGVPAVILDERHLISGGQPVEVFEQALRRVAAGDVR
ncbi:MAG: DsbA family oxidoreductase [Dokdonella sp.]|uniref:DsbA family oxidoreductase n=1 Tax=Dokdonella sp. TaxID=2291710 RepID=UPI003F80AAF7